MPHMSATSVATPEAGCAGQPQPQQPASTLSLLQRKPSFVERRPSCSSSCKAPLLQPVALQPHRWSSATLPLASLANIQRIEINGTRERDGVTYYVLDVFLHHFNTRLPATLTYLRQACSSPPYASSIQSTTTSQPDYQLERRFSEFCDLRSFVYDVACLDPQFRCEYCHAFIVYVRFKSQQPGVLTKLLKTGTDKRKHMLAGFIMDFVRMAQWRHLQNRKCKSHDAVPLFVEQFVRRNDACEATDSPSL